jgi:hypothetical protein
MNTLTKLQTANKQHDLYLIPHTYLRIHEKISLELRKWYVANRISEQELMEAYERLTVDVIIDAALVLRRQIGNHCIGRRIPQIAEIALKVITLQNDN